ncbi:hypothetical protein FOA52_007751 [Chlamydomonas sp. UWO 241]|nr:hypothetical protein FOA52_007751 [Chlamydomonas sp. UWO 241]
MDYARSEEPFIHKPRSGEYEEVEPGFGAVTTGHISVDAPDRMTSLSPVHDEPVGFVPNQWLLVSGHDWTEYSRQRSECAKPGELALSPPPPGGVLGACCARDSVAHAQPRPGI